MIFSDGAESCIVITSVLQDTDRLKDHTTDHGLLCQLHRLSELLKTFWLNKLHVCILRSHI